MTNCVLLFASYSLAPAEKRYSQLDKEALPIVIGVKHFHKYLFRRHFMIKSDHKPLQHLLGERKGIPVMASARVQQWALILSAYNYTVQYVPGKDNANADFFSRLPLSVQPQEVPMPQESVYLLEGLEISPVTVDQIRLWTDRNPVLSKVCRFVQHGLLSQLFSHTTQDSLSSVHKTNACYGETSSWYLSREERSCCPYLVIQAFPR